MNKKLLALILALLMVFAVNVPVMGAEKPVSDNKVSIVNYQVIFSDTITVTAKGGKFRIGFVTMDFPKNFLDSDNLPATFQISIFAKSGEAGIEINPSTTGFRKNVEIDVHEYNGFLYDKGAGKNIWVNIDKQTIIAPHFSWFRFR